MKPWLFLTFISLSCLASEPFQLYLGGKKIYWQDPKKPNRFHLDLNRDGNMDGLDVLLEDGMDAYSDMHPKNGFGKKLRVRIEKNAVVEKYQKKIGKNWETYLSKKITKVNENEADYQVWKGDKDEKDIKLAFEERLDSSSLQSKPSKNSTKSKPQVKPKQEELASNHGTPLFHFEQSCLDACGKLAKHFKLDELSDKVKCQEKLQSMTMQSLDSTISCLLQNNELKNVGSAIAHRILTGLRPAMDQMNQSAGHISISCVENRQYQAKLLGILPQDKKQIELDVTNLMSEGDTSLEQRFNKTIGHEVYHLGKYFHSHNEVDVSYACNECCDSADALACHVCSRSDQIQMGDIDYLLATMIYQKFVGPNKQFRPYHKALEKLHQVVQNEKFFEEFEKKIPISKEELIDSLYAQLTVHLRNPVDDRGEGKLRYSDMLAEVMAKVSCSGIGRAPSDTRSGKDRYACEVMYLARSVPASYCHDEESKQSCVQAIRLRYARRKKIDQTGIPIPDNFLSLDRSYD